MAKAKKSRHAATAIADELAEIMGHFGEARSLVVVCQRSLDSLEQPHGGDEADALLAAIEKLRIAYNELDAFAARCSKLLQST